MASRQSNSSNGSASSGSRQKRFSIDDAFEEETDEAIKVYGATTTMSPVGTPAASNGDVNVRIDGTG